MPECLSLKSTLFPSAERKEFLGTSVPWEVPRYADDFQRAEKAGGFFDLSAWGVVTIDGADAREFLQRMTATDLRQPLGSRIAHCACLNGRGLVQALGYLQENNAGYRYLLSPGQVPRAMEYLEKFHFAENLVIADASEEWALFACYRLPLPLAEAWIMTASTAPLEVQSVAWESVRFEVWKDDVRSDLVWIKVGRGAAQQLMAALVAAQVSLLGQRLFEFFRIQNAVPQVGLEITGSEILLETAFERAISRNKGCYPGQEVIERIFTYGQVNRKLLRVSLEFRGREWPELPWILSAEAKEAGKVVSFAQDPKDPHRGVGLAYVHRRFWDGKTPFEIEKGITVTLVT